ncbi:hypothetical protein Tsubulata_017193 [Turnera subulata]|uniref:Pentacotripeptide-repeat region of PRORP domain-containing protein n=1 Tax=Turnera subulata TaxID=218843 RepID=A0A9Q0JRX5_9ROSI|nr:hypothetical protein Tsubulata_017193 [Turnera subulata]
MNTTAAAATRILHLLSNSFPQSQPHLNQIQAQLILHNLRSNTTVARHFISAVASQSLSFLHHSLPLFFSHLHTRPHVFTCNSLIKAFAHSHTPRLPHSIYSYMLRHSIAPNNYTYPFLLKSLSDSKEFEQGRCVHSHVVKLGHSRDIYVLNALLNLYASWGRMGLCRQVFDEMPERDVVSWTVLIMGHRNAGEYGDALVAFEKMGYAGVVPNRVTMVNALGACGSYGAVEMGIRIHDFIRRNRWEMDVILGTSLIGMYFKCGRVEEALGVFASMEKKNVFTWNAVIKGLAFAKCGEDAVWWFNRMEQEGHKPDEVTLINVLSACSHSGLVDIGREIFGFLLDGKYGFSPGVKHYACMIDLLVRSGFLEDGLKLIAEMPFEPTKSMWGSLLAGCKARGNLELGEVVAKELLELEPENSAYYIVLSNLYAQMERWDDVAKTRELMKHRGLNKDMGCSSVESELWENYQCLLSQ